MEDGVYVCSWSKSADGFTLWIKARPKIRAAGSTFSEAESRFIDAIQAAGGAMHAVLEFNPKLPKSAIEEKYSNPEVYLIVGDDRFETNAPRWKWGESEQEVDERLRWHDAYYKSPVCRQCRHASSRRSESPLTLQYASGRFDGAFGCVGSDAGSTHQLVSERFVDLLSAHERTGLELRPTIGKHRKKFYELVGPEGPAKVAVDGLSAAGWQCSKCGHQEWGYFLEGIDISSFIARSDLPATLPGIFTVGRYPEIELVATAARWKELVGRQGTRGFVSRLLGVVPDREVIRNLSLPLRAS